MGETALAALAGLVCGAALGAAARLARYCVMGAIEDAVYGDSLDRMRMLGVSAAVAIAGAWALIALGVFDPAETRAGRLGLTPAAAVLGGAMFGYGMALVGTCAFGALARVGGGDLRSLAVVSTIGVAAFATTSGVLSPLRLWLSPPAAAEQSLATTLGDWLSIPPALAAFAPALALAALSLRGAGGRRGHVAFWGAVVGGAVALGWLATALLAGGFDAVPVESLSFAAPTGETMLYLMTEARLVAPGFTVGGVVGVVAGAALASAWRGDSRWETSDDPRELRRQLVGGAMMGVGGALALGCTIGQGLTALSVLSPMAPVVMLAILVGARAGLYVLVEGLPAARKH